MTARERFEALYAEHAGAVLAYARRRTAQGSADDLVAEVFLVAWRRLEDVPADARVWLLAVARRTLANQRRGEARRAALHSRLTEERPSDGGASGADAEVRDERVLRALSSLSESDREVLLLLGWEQLTARDAARVLGIRAGTFNVRLHRARRRFARALAAGGHHSHLPAESTPTLEAQ